MDYIGVRGVEGPDSTGVSTDAQVHIHAVQTQPFSGTLTPT
jgi:hypothetical protein